MSTSTASKNLDRSRVHIASVLAALPRSVKATRSRDYLSAALLTDVSPDECWPWPGAIDRAGYGHANYPGEGGRANSAHRVVWEVLFGSLPSDVEVDHRCHDPAQCAGGRACPHRRCVNPHHLAPSTWRENWENSNSPSRLNALKTHCVNEHEFTNDNTYITPRGYRQCRTCQRESSAKYERSRRNRSRFKETA